MSIKALPSGLAQDPERLARFERASMAKLFDMFMTILPDGREPTEAEYRDLLSAGGFSLRRSRRRFHQFQ
jgi:hypothetical protein